MVARYGSKIDGERIHLNWSFSMDLKVCTTWLFNIAMENGPFIDGLPVKNGDFPWLC
jgi:hypothetical protein